MRVCLLTALFLVLGLSQAAFSEPPGLPGVGVNTNVGLNARTNVSRGGTGIGVGGQTNVGGNVQINRPSVQNGTGRLGQSAIPGAVGRANATARINTQGTMRSQPQRPPQSQQRPQQAGNSNNQQNQRMADTRAAAQAGAQVAATPAEARRQEFRRRMAEIDHQRDAALRVGDRRRLEECDRMEHEVRARFAAEETAAARANMPHGPTNPGFGRQTAQEAHANSNGQASVHANTNYPPPPANRPGFTPGYGRLTAEQAQSLKLNQQPPAQQPPAQQPPAEQPPTQQPPTQQPPAEPPPAQQPSAPPGPVQ